MLWDCIQPCSKTVQGSASMGPCVLETKEIINYGFKSLSDSRILQWLLIRTDMLKFWKIIVELFYLLLQQFPGYRCRHTGSIDQCHVDRSYLFSMKSRTSSYMVHDGYGLASWQTNHHVWICIIMTRLQLNANESVQHMHQAHRTNKAVLIKYGSIFCYWIVHFLPEMFWEAYFSLLFHCNMKKFVTRRRQNLALSK